MCYVLTKQSLMVVFPITNSKLKAINSHLVGEIKILNEEGKWFLFVRVLLSNKWKNFKQQMLKQYVLRLLLQRKSGAFLFAYRPSSTNKDKFFEEIFTSLNKILGNYENIVLAGDLNIDELNSCSDSSNHLSDMKDVFNLSNLIKEPPCLKSKNGILLDLILTNRPKSFIKSQAFKLGLSDCHKFVCSILRASFKKLPPKIITYRYQKDFHQQNFLRNLDKKLVQEQLYKSCDEPYKKLSEFFNVILNYHAPLKEKQGRGNHAPFITKELSKAIMEKFKSRNKYLKWPS